MPSQPKRPATLRYTILTEGGVEPRRALAGDAGYDLFVSESVTIPPGSFADTHTGIAVELPPGVWGLLVGRSSTLRKRGLHVPIGIIDNGYRGELFAGAYNLTADSVRIAAGERIAQLILMPLLAFPLEEMQSLQPTDRGAAGFGSTGG